jgi:hypothetical protein
VWYYSVNKTQWRYIKGPKAGDPNPSTNPPLRQLSQGWFVADSLEFVIWGEGTTVGDMWSFDMVDWTWTNRTQQFAPPWRRGAATFNDQNKLYMFGGQANSPADYNDFWVFEYPSGGWSRVLTAASEFPTVPPTNGVFDAAYRPSVRARIHSHQVPGSRLVYVYSGNTWEGAAARDVWVFSFDLIMWARVSNWGATATFSPVGVASASGL